MNKKITPGKLREMKEEGEKITMITAYDYPSAKVLERTEIDSVLVGDSVGNTVLGYENTMPVTMEEMIRHTKAVSRGLERPLLIADMPFLSYQTSVEDAVRNAGRFIKETGAQAVKVEGGSEFFDQIRRIIDAGVPVLGHLGLTPQRIHQFGGYQPRGRTVEEAKKIYDDAQKLEEVGVFGLVLESIPKELGRKVTEKIDIPTIGIGAGPHCDGQVLVFHDLLGWTEFSPKFLKKYADLISTIEEAVNGYIEEVKSVDFPTSEHSYEMDEEILKELMDYLD
ncbi:3-methyl-2-oxobutanoate hydroxymethyltransferase [candidate division MSBL1 archaeon SCGC-AAA259J03]|uniref:3-methyl-2-oxobutanoate hydroxymethyltransferase n=2 Tax=candidate division MSBL1 TaxID=215777 RepID=A0A656YY49_9EURY|nr:3-methyl-2-oxobutanoate hydroxymethyltransferase [candidate division MSBL1 archaeon SCGC-AAA259I07]KXA98844.1 3-methyl-2-oxobutanoate hydroxymethyltransferase [candidate division MSBL1 archaeon SCGC-AAA259J03]